MNDKKEFPGDGYEVIKNSMSALGKKTLLTLLENELCELNTGLYVSSDMQEVFRIQGNVRRLEWMINLFNKK